MNKPEFGEFKSIGRPLPRKEDLRLLTGKGQFTDDFSFPGQTYAAIVRSPYAHARIVSVDKSAAEAVPGVLCVLCGQDLVADGLKPIPHSAVPSTKYDMKLHAWGGGKVFEGPHHLLAIDKARHVGEAVAIVVGETLAQALDGAEAVAVEYEELPFVLHSGDAMQPGAPAVWDEVADNVLVDTEFGDKAATDAAFAKADHVVEATWFIPRATAVTIEPRACVGNYDQASGRYTLYAGSGGAVKQKREMAGALCEDPKNFRLLSLDVGGNFGSKNRPYVEYGLVLWASKKIGRPVRFTATRSEAFMTDYQGRDLVTKVSLALNKTGKFLAMRADNISNVGARCVSLSPLSKGSGLINGNYDIPVAHLRSRAVFTNTMMTQAYRSSGRPEVNFAIERLIDKAARELGFDRVEIRKRNFIQPEQMPYKSAVGNVFDSGQYEEAFDIAWRISDAEGFEARKKESAARGKLRGLGIAPYVESSIGFPNERVEITVKPDGDIDVIIGTQPSGQGHETSFAQVVADLLYLPYERIKLIMGDTDVVTVGGGSHSGRSMRHAATVISKASDQMIARAKEIAAVLMETTADNVKWDQGRLSSEQSNLTFDLTELAAAAAKGRLPDPLKDGLMVVQDSEMHDPVFPNGCAICEVEVDPETGEVEIKRYAAVDDVGRCINPLIVHGQTHGGIAQGVGQAMWELWHLDPATGQPLSASLMDYGLPRTDNMPSYDTEIQEVLSPTNPLGIKAGGEGGTTPALSVMISAISDALKEYGVTHVEMPATPFKVWQTIQDAQRKQAAE
ncbi:MAG: hypothetical protein RLZ98_824 [Pseudomonadota bacterium]